jgi:hypothetical protein
MRRPLFDRAIVNLRNFYRLKIIRRSLTIACLVLAALIGYVDYLPGYEHSMLLFYFNWKSVSCSARGALHQKSPAI